MSKVSPCAFIVVSLGLTACGSGSTAEGSSSVATTSSSSSGMVDTSKTEIKGTLGDMGPVLPIVSSYYISNSGETLVYLSSAPLSCALLTQSPWLQQVAAGAQVIELIVHGDPSSQEYPVPPGEVNYAPGGKSHNYEKTADAGKITYTKVELRSLVEGTVTATYGTNSISGAFHATYCDGGQDY